jgi:hypothetical protein
VSHLWAARSVILLFCLRETAENKRICKIWGFYGGDYEECRIWGFHSGDYEECGLLVYKNPLRTSQETHDVFATEPIRLMLCKTWGFTAGTMKNAVFCYIKNPVLTSQETHDVSASEPRRLMLCKIWGFHGGNYEEFRLLGCDAVWLL